MARQQDERKNSKKNKHTVNTGEQLKRQTTRTKKNTHENKKQVRKNESTIQNGEKQKLKVGKKRKRNAEVTACLIAAHIFICLCSTYTHGTEMMMMSGIKCVSVYLFRLATESIFNIELAH